MKSLRICENFNFHAVAENIYRSMTVIKQSLIWRYRKGKGGCAN